MIMIAMKMMLSVRVKPNIGFYSHKPYNKIGSIGHAYVSK